VRQAGASVDIIGRPRLYALIGMWRILWELRRVRPDLVHTELPGGDLIGRTLARIAGIRPIVSTVTARYVDKPRIQFLLDRATIGWADRVVFQSAEIIPFSVAHEGVKPDQIVCIPNSVDLRSAASTEAAAELRRQYGGGARTVIGMVARLHPQKAHRVLLTAFTKVAASRDDIRLWLVGDGPERGRLAAQVQDLSLADRVVFAGDRNDARSWTAAMDIFVHPTYFEGLPTAVLEAMAAGKPVITSPVDGLVGLITCGVDGWLVEPGDAAALADAIQYVLDHPGEAAKVARAGAERVWKDFGVGRQVEAYDRLFKSLVADRAVVSATARR
jgi:glycosyltransferase involved in cell wall biosynthesis